MATYNAVLIGTGFIGSDNIQITEANGDGSLNQLIANVGNETYIIDSFEIWSDDIDQLHQPIGLLQVEPNGNACGHYIVPQKPLDSISNVLKDMKTNNFPIDENTRISYNVNPGATVKLTLNINKDVRNDFSFKKMLEEFGSHSIKPDVLKALGYREPEEMYEKVISPKIQVNKCMATPKEIKQPPKKKKPEIPVKTLLAGLVITVGVFIVYYNSEGAAFFDKKF